MRRFLPVVIIIALIFPAVSYRADAYSAECYVLMDYDTADVLCGENEHMRHSMASTTKIMTALLLCESGALSRIVKVNANAVNVEGTAIGISGGDLIPRENLLYGLMLESGNDAANAIAYELGGSLDGFAKMMNERAAKIGMKNTHFVTPSGLDDDEHYTTAYDMGLLCIEAMKNSDFRAAVATKSYRSVYNSEQTVRTYSNHNRLLTMLDGAEGVKTGFTKKSGRCLVSACTRDDKRLIAVTLNASDDWNDHTDLYDYGFSLYKKYTLKYDNIQKTLPVAGGAEAKVSISVNPVDISLKSGENDRIEYTVSLPRFVYAPVLCGEKLGEVRYYYNSRLVASSDITADSRIAIKSKVQPSITEQIITIIKILLSV